jgi:integrase
LNQEELFLSSIKSKETRDHYSLFLQKFMDFKGDLYPNGSNDKEIENKIIEFVVHLRNQGKSHGAISNYLAPIKLFYSVNDVVLNVKKIDRFMPEQKKKRKDRAYTHEEISKFLSIADERMKVVILLMASSGIRIGAIPTLRLKHLQDKTLTVYENTNDEYFTFITPECAKAVDNYQDMRARYGEKLNDESFLIREQFDVRCPGKPRPIERHTIQYKLYDLAARAGVDKNDVAVAHGFRKFFTTQLINSNVKDIVRLRLEGHSLGITDHYWRPTEQEMLDEYMKAVNALTINEENRLKLKLEGQESNYEKLDAKIDALARKFLENNTLLGGPEGIGRKPTEQEIKQLLEKRRMKANLRRKAENQLQAEL